MEGFGEAVAGADGTWGDSEAEVTFPTRGPQAQYGEVSSASLILETAAPRFSEFG